MITIRAMTDGASYLGRHLSNSDYYDQDRKIQGHWIGQGAKRLGLEEGQAVLPESFDLLRQNLHPNTREKLTPRTNTVRLEKGREVSNRRCFYDAVCSAPKSVSVMALVAGDQRLIEAHHKACRTAFCELEKYSQTQVSAGKTKKREFTANLVAAEFAHDTSRALDPQLHNHFVIMVPTWDPKRERWIALEAGEIYARTKYLSEVYRNELAKEVLKCGYQIQAKANGFEISGVSEAVVKRYSQRSDVRDQAVADQEKALGRTLTNDEIAVLVRESRADKLTTISTEKVKATQRSLLSQPEWKQLETLKNQAAPKQAATKTEAKIALDYAAEHCFERRTVVQDYELFAESLRSGYGEIDLEELHQTFKENKRFLKAGSKVATRESLAREMELVKFIDGTKEKLAPLGRATKAAAAPSEEQAGAIGRVLGSRDQVTVLRGAAGTGKTTVLASIIAGTESETVVFAPTSKAVEVLKKDAQQCGKARASESLRQANTVQALLQSEKLQQSCKNRLVVVDEYSFLSVRDLHRLCQIAREQNARLLLAGDSRQHLSVAAGDAARIVEQETKVRIAELATIRRQINPAYREAVQSLALEQTDKGLNLLQKDGAVVEIRDRQQRHVQMVGDYLSACHETKAVRTPKGMVNVQKQCLMIVPTWQELDEVTDVLRQQLKAESRLPSSGTDFKILRDTHRTLAERKNLRKFRGGEVLVFHKPSKEFAKHEEVRVLGVQGEHLAVQRCDGCQALLSPRQASAYSVYQEKQVELCVGDKIRLSANAVDNQGKKIANGSLLTVQNVDSAGWVTTQDGRKFQSRIFNHGYAVTSHASQGTTCDKVFVADALTKQGLYVSASRGRESVKFYTTDRQRFLATAGLRSEERQSALELAREAKELSPGLSPATDSLGMICEAFRQGLAHSHHIIGLFLRYAAQATQRLAQLGQHRNQGQKLTQE